MLFVEQIDELGRIVVPEEIREQLELKIYDLIVISGNKEKIIITKLD